MRGSVPHRGPHRSGFTMGRIPPSWRPTWRGPLAGADSATAPQPRQMPHVGGGAGPWRVGNDDAGSATLDGLLLGACRKCDASSVLSLLECTCEAPGELGAGRGAGGRGAAASLDGGTSDAACARALKRVSTTTGWTCLSVACDAAKMTAASAKSGDDWIDLLCVILSHAGRDVDFVNASSGQGFTAFYGAVEDSVGRKGVDEYSLAVAAALLAHGAKPDVPFRGVLPLDATTNPTLQSLIQLATTLGDGREAVRRWLADPHRPLLLQAPGWDKLARLRPLLELDRCVERALIATWGAYRKRDLPGKRKDMLKLWSRVPRACLAEVLLHMSK